MKSLQEEREAIIDEFRTKFVDFNHDINGNLAYTEWSYKGDSQEAVDWLRTALLSHEEKVLARVITEDTSDGYHTFKELYEFRLLYNAHLFNEWALWGVYDVHKSQRHSDGELCFGRNDYFIVVATLPTGQISNHYPMTDWDLFRCEAVEKAKHTWDGHSSQDVAKRLREALTSPIRDEKI